MHNSAGTIPLVAAPHDDSRRLIAADLRSLIAQIETSMRLIDAAMTRSEGSGGSGSTNIVVLDDVTPRYATANAALGACKASLDFALRSLSDSGRSDEIAAAAGRRPQLMAQEPCSHGP